MKKKKYKIVKKVNKELNHMILSMYQPAPSPDQADELLWIVDIYEKVSETIELKGLNELEDALVNLGFKSFQYQKKQYYYLNHKRL